MHEVVALAETFGVLRRIEFMFLVAADVSRLKLNPHDSEPKAGF